MGNRVIKWDLLLFSSTIFTLTLCISLIQSMATDVSVSATIGATAPSVDLVLVNDIDNDGANNPITPGTSFLVNATFSDSNGLGTVCTTVGCNVSCWGSTESETSQSSNTWDWLTNSSPSVDSTDGYLLATLTTTGKAVNGTWTCIAYVNDTDGLLDSESNTTTMNLRTGLVLHSSSCSYGTISLGSSDNAWDCGSSEEYINITHDGNYIQDFKINGTDLTFDTNTLGVGNQTWTFDSGFAASADNCTDGSGTQLSSSSSSMVAGGYVSRGDSSSMLSSVNKTFVCLSAPSILASGTYSGTVSILTNNP